MNLNETKTLPMQFFRSDTPSADALEAIARALPEIKDSDAKSRVSFLLFDSQPDVPGAYVTPYDNRGEVQDDMETIMQDYEAPFFVTSSRNTVRIERNDFSFDGNTEEVRRLELISFKWIN